MGRRSTHTPDELRKLILDAAYAIIETNGLAGLSAREIARRIGYSAGTIYNIYVNLDDVILNVEARVLDDLARDLETVAAEAYPDTPARVRALARAYLAFTHKNPKLWNLLFEHFLPNGADTPSWYQGKLDGLLGHVETAVAPMFSADDAESKKRSARVLWASVHGITSLSTTMKLTSVTTEGAQILIDDLVTHYLAGLRATVG